jgi:hypothetical protein
MNTFRLSNKKVYNDSRSSIEHLHNEKMSEILNKNDTLDVKNKKLEYLNQKIKFIENDNTNNTNNNDNTIINKFNNINDIKNEIKQLKDEIHSIVNNHDLIDYIDKAWDFIINFDETDNNETDNNETDKNETVTENNIQEETCNNNETEIKSGILNFVTKTGKSNKGEEYSKYYNRCFLNRLTHDNNTNINCKNCKENNFEIDPKNGLIVCINCGLCENYIECNSSSINYSDTTHIETISQQFSYQRKNHFKEWLNQLQGKEVTTIPASVINLVLIELKKERITDINDITSDRIKKYLKKLKLNKYYEHIPNLISKITHKPQLIITPEFEDILLKLFDKIQIPFKEHCPKDRKNFLSYSYTLHKFCKLLGKNEYLVFFPLLKSREKLFEQEKIWKEICNDLNWKFTPSI